MIDFDFMRRCAQQVGVEISAMQIEQLDAYAAAMVETNASLNLTRVTEPDEICIKHYADSMTLLSYVSITQGESLIDVGTGAGFPGIVLKIMRPDLRVTLLDSLAKRLSFIEKTASSLGIEVECVHSRAEDAGKSQTLRESFDIVTSRAVARMNVLSEYCLPLCRVGGRFCAMKGPEGQAELEECRNALPLLGAGDVHVDSFSLFDCGERCIITVCKSEPTPPKYPRTPAKISKSPLA